MSGKIYTPSTTTALTNDPNSAGGQYFDVTGTTVGQKRGMDLVTIGGASEIMPAILALIAGTMPRVNWDQIDKETLTSTSYQYIFSYLDNEQFRITVTNAYGDFSLSVVDSGNGYVNEDGLIAIGLEDGSELLLEG